MYVCMYVCKYVCMYVWFSWKKGQIILRVTRSTTLALHCVTVFLTDCFFSFFLAQPLSILVMNCTMCLVTLLWIGDTWKLRCLGGSETSKSAILDGKQLFLSKQVYRKSRNPKIGYFRWKTAVFMKSGV